mgnify:CR=1 FL=1
MLLFEILDLINDFSRIFKYMEYNIKLKNGLLLKGMISSPGEQMRALVILVHGLGEHINRYKHVSEFLNVHDIGFTGLDLPGHGKSGGSRGHIKNFSLTDEMIDTIIAETGKTFPGIPVFIYGHSLGGLIVLDYLLRKNPSVRGAIVTSPWLKLSFEPSGLKVFLASVFGVILPGFIQPSGLVTGDLSHDQAVVDAYISDPLVHDKISAGLFSSAISTSKSTLSNAGKLDTSLLLMHGSDDRICSPEGSREFISKAKNVEFKIWEGGFHELHNETFKSEVLDHILSWINKHLG